MKRLLKILHVIRGLPEEARRLLAGLSLVLAAIIVFSGWSIIMPSRLTALSGEPRPLSEGHYPMLPNDTGDNLAPGTRDISKERGETVSPPASISSPGLEGVPQGEETLSPLEGITESFRSLRSVLGPQHEERNSLASITAFFEKAWRYVYEPLK